MSWHQRKGNQDHLNVLLTELPQWLFTGFYNSVIEGDVDVSELHSASRVMVKVSLKRSVSVSASELYQPRNPRL
jgi:hypothetical protein